MVNYRNTKVTNQILEFEKKKNTNQNNYKETKKSMSQRALAILKLNPGLIIWHKGKLTLLGTGMLLVSGAGRGLTYGNGRRPPFLEYRIYSGVGGQHTEMVDLSFFIKSLKIFT